MKEFALCLILILALAAGIVWWSKAGPIYGVQMSHQIAVAPAEQPKAAPPSPRPATRRAAPVPAPEPAEPLPEVTAPAAPPAVAEPPAPPPPFPSGEQIRSGAEADAIVETYGKPTLSAITSEKKHLLETFVYTRNTEPLQTLIQIEDGKVQSAQSVTRPASVIVVGPGVRARY